jgi:hypothetical protein
MTGVHYSLSTSLPPITQNRYDYDIVVTVRYCLVAVEFRCLTKLMY